MLAEKADLGIAWDGDGDRAVFVDERGEAVPADLMTALFCDVILERKLLGAEPGMPFLYDLRSSRIVPETTARAAPSRMRGRVGHAFMKAVMRERGACFGGELSGPLLLPLPRRLHRRRRRGRDAAPARGHGRARALSELWQPYRRYRQSGEINRRVADVAQTLARVRAEYPDGDGRRAGRSHRRLSRLVVQPAPVEHGAAPAPEPRGARRRVARAPPRSRCLALIGRVTALRVLRRAWTMLRRERSLWPWVLVPFALNLVAFGLAAAVFVANLDVVAGPLERMLTVATPEHWYGYIVAGPLWLLAALVRAGAAGRVRSRDLLRVHGDRRGDRGAVPGRAVGAGRAARRAAPRRRRRRDWPRCSARGPERARGREAGRVPARAAGCAARWSGSCPGCSRSRPRRASRSRALFLPLVYTGFALDRRGVRFAARRRWVVRHPFEMLSFGGFALAALRRARGLVPVPALAGDRWNALLALELWPASDGPRSA